MLTREEAEKKFKEFLDTECPSCKAPIGQLCDRDGVWVHMQRMIHVVPDAEPNDGRQYYIKHVNDVPFNGDHVYGPFLGREIDDRFEDDYAEILADCGDISIVRLTSDEVKQYQSHTREYWMAQLSLVQEFGK